MVSISCLCSLPKGLSISTQSQTQIEQDAFLQRQESCRILSSLRDESSSLLWLRDDDSCGTKKSAYTETSEFLDASFVFDPEVSKSRAYLAVMKSNLKRAVTASAQVGGREYLLSKPLGSATYAASVTADQTEHKQSSTLSEEPHALSSPVRTVRKLSRTRWRKTRWRLITARTTQSADRPEDGGSPIILPATCSEDTVALEGHARKVEEQFHLGVRPFPGGKYLLPSSVKTDSLRLATIMEAAGT